MQATPYAQDCLFAQNCFCAQDGQGSACVTARAVQPLDSHQLQTVLAFIDGNLTEKLALGQIAGQVHMSASYLAPRFKAATGISLHQYIVLRRLERARELVQVTNRPIAEIAASVGFTDHSHLTRSYKKRFGAPPLSNRGASRYAPI